MQRFIVASFGLVLALLALVRVEAQPPFLVKDINPIPASGSSTPTKLVNVGGTLFFTADHPLYGRELWKSDGTDNGTVLVKDIRAGHESSSLDHLTAVGNTLFFTADDGISGVELWKSDGTHAGTVRVADLIAGTQSSFPRSLAAFNDKLVFVARSSPSLPDNYEIWISDGTEAGTNKLSASGLPPAGTPYPGEFTQVGDWLFFSATNSSSGRELWKTKGDAASTVLVKDINPGTAGSSPQKLIAVEESLFFVAYTAVTGFELWKTDGTEEGTELIKDIRPGAVDSSISGMVAVKSSVFFSANDGVAGIELWKSDGTADGTEMVLDLIPGAGSSSPQQLVNVDGKLFFSATFPSFGPELGTSDGTAGGTILVKDIRPGISGSTIAHCTAIGSTLFFVANDGISSAELWTSDGTVSGTVMLKDINPGNNSSSPDHLTVVGEILFFSAFQPGTTRELWKSDGSGAGTVIVSDIVTTTASSFPSMGFPEPVNISGKIFFAATDGVHGDELWVSDGTDAGTKMVKDINPGSASSSPYEFCVVNGLLFFQAENNTHGTELWRSDGTTSGTYMVADITPGILSSSPEGLVNLNGILYFSAYTPTSGYELWRSDGTAQGTVMVKDINPGAGHGGVSGLTVFNGALYFRANNGAAGSELWRSDGTADGTVMVKDINPGFMISSNPSNLTVANGLLFFVATTNAGQELWKSDGTEAGTVMVKDIWPGASSSFPEYLTAADGLLYFTANDNASGVELWKSDGTDDGTVMIKDIYPGIATSSPQYLIPLGAQVLFAATNPTYGRELWITDGSPDGTTLVKDILPGANGSSPVALVRVDDLVYFVANDGVHGHELWRSDGTMEGTFLFGETSVGEGDGCGAGTAPLVRAGPFLFFFANHITAARELWAVVVNPPAVVTLSGNPVTFTENSEPVILDAWASVTDSNTTNFDGGSLIVELVANETSDDSLLIVPTAKVRRNGANVEFDESGVFAGGEVIFGTVPAAAPGTGIGGDSLVVNFNTNCTPEITEALLRSIAFSNSSDNPSTATRIVRITVWDGDAAFSGPSNQPIVEIVIVPVNDAPVLTGVNTLTGGVEDTLLVITHAALLAASDATDVDSATIGFRIESISSGSLTLNGGSVTTGVTVLGTGDQLEWTPDADANGILPAFTVVAFDGDLASAGAVQVAVDVAPVNDAPVLTAVNTLPGGVEDTLFVITHAALLAASDAADVDSPTLGFRIESITSGSLTLNGGPVTTGVTVLGTGDQLEWTPDADANGLLQAFTVTAFDGDLGSTGAVQVSVDVAPVNDAPTLTSVNTLTGGIEDTQFVITYTALLAACDAADVDSPTLGFRIESITSGSLTLNGGPVTAGISVLGTGDQLEWTPAGDANGILPAFTVVAFDGDLASAGAVQVAVDVAPVNDAPVLTSVNTLTGALFDAPFSISYEMLLSASNAADIDSADLSFRITAISTGTLTLDGNPVIPGVTLVSANDFLLWIPPTGARGVTRAFTVTAWDGALSSSPPVQVSVLIVPKSQGGNGGCVAHHHAPSPIFVFILAVWLWRRATRNTGSTAST